MKITRGTSIIEIVIAAALISMAIIAALSLANHSQKQNTYARDLAEATKYTTQAADWIRAQRSSLGWATLAAKGDGIYCLNTVPADFSLIQDGDCDAGDYIPNTLFDRTITLNNTGTALQVTITVNWQDSTTRQATIQMELTQW